MNSRMDKYTDTPLLKKRTEKNRELYEKINNAEISSYDINNNATVLGEDINNIDVNIVKDMLDKRYRDEINKKAILEIDDSSESEEKVIDTKEYDINKILEKAKETKNVDYKEERLKTIHNTQYDILKNLSITDNEEKMEDSEENIVNLINTITHLEMQNSEKSGNTTALDLLSDLTDSDTNTIYKTMELDKEKISNNTTDNLDEEDLSIEEKYEDFKELERDLKSNNIAIKVISIIFILIIVTMAVIFCNNYFNLGLF